MICFELNVNLIILHVSHKNINKYMHKWHKHMTSRDYLREIIATITSIEKKGRLSPFNHNQ